MSTNLNPGIDTNMWTITTPTDYAVLGAVEIKEVKNFLLTTTPLMTINLPVGETWVATLNTSADMWPGSLQIVDISGSYYVEFNTTISFTVQCSSGHVCLLQDTVQAQGLLGVVGTVTPSTATIIPPAVVPNAGSLGNTATTVFGSIDIATFFVNVLESKSVEVALNGGTSPAPPLV